MRRHTLLFVDLALAANRGADFWFQAAGGSAVKRANSQDGGDPEDADYS
jgi:hypothetical protein